MAETANTADKPAEAQSRFGALQLMGFANKEELGKKGLDYLMNPKWSIYVSWFLLVVDAVLCALILRTVNYTEIDWKTYMQQVEVYIKGERDYSMISGDTGPLVYPAMHVYIYRFLHDWTENGTNILLAQVYFAVLYIFNLGVVMACYRAARAPPYVYPMLILSKRLHSIYLLRCFNDGFAMGFLFLAILLMQKKEWTWGVVVFSLGLGVKMSLLLALPAIAVLVYQANGPWEGSSQLSFVAQVQLLIGIPFLRKNAWAYLGRAFEFSRTFNYEWTVNWKFISEERFLSKEWSIGLLVLHVSLLVLFIVTRWMRPLGRSPRDLVRLANLNPSASAQKMIIKQLSADFILTSIFTSLVIGALCARSLHYQFYSWIAWATPFLLYKSKINPLLQVLIWSGQELAWNRFPADELSSKIVVSCLAVIVVHVWLGTDEVPTKTVIQARNEILNKPQEGPAGFAPNPQMKNVLKARDQIFEAKAARQDAAAGVKREPKKTK